MRQEAVGLLVGAGMLAVAAAFHPLFADPWGSTAVLSLIAGDRLWEADHLLMAAAMFLWLGALAGIAYQGSPARGPNAARSLSAAAVFAIGLTIWLLILALEATWVQPAARWALQQSAEVQMLVNRMGGSTLLAGDFAMLAIWLGTIALAHDLGRIGWIADWLATFGRSAGWIGVIGIIGGLIDHDHSLLWLFITSFFPFLWTLLLGIALLRKNASEGSLP